MIRRRLWFWWKETNLGCETGSKQHFGVFSFSLLVDLIHPLEAKIPDTKEVFGIMLSSFKQIKVSFCVLWRVSSVLSDLNLTVNMFVCYNHILLTHTTVHQHLNTSVRILMFMFPSRWTVTTVLIQRFIQRHEVHRTDDITSHQLEH